MSWGGRVHKPNGFFTPVTSTVRTINQAMRHVTAADNKSDDTRLKDTVPPSLA